MRNQGMGKGTITATPRQLESMVRLSEGLARMRLSPTVERHDVAEAVRLMKVSCHAYLTSICTYWSQQALCMHKISSGCCFSRLYSFKQCIRHAP